MFDSYGDYIQFLDITCIPILFITTILELSHFENSFWREVRIVQISRDYWDNFTVCK